MIAPARVGCDQVGMVHVASGNFTSAQPLGVIRGVDMQYAGKVRRCNTKRLRQLLDSGDIVLVGCLGYSAAGEVFNCSSEEVAMVTASQLGAQKLVFMYEGDEVHGSLPHGGEQPSARGGDGSGFGGGAVHVHSMTVELAERCLAATSHPIVPDDDDDVDATARGGDQLPAPAGGGGCSSDVGGAGGSDDCAFPERESCSCSWSFPMYHLRVVIIMIRTLDRLRLTYVLRYRF